MADKIIKNVGDHWVLPPEGMESLTTSVCDVEALLDLVDCELDTPEKGETADIDGQEAIELTSGGDAEDCELDTPEKGETADPDIREAIELTSGGDAEDGGTTSVWVAVDDPHHILLILQETSDSSSVSMSFSEFNKEVAWEAPAEDDVLPWP